MKCLPSIRGSSLVPWGTFQSHWVGHLSCSAPILLTLREGPSLQLGEGFVVLHKNESFEALSWNLELCLYFWPPKTSLPSQQGYLLSLVTMCCAYQTVIVIMLVFEKVLSGGQPSCRFGLSRWAVCLWQAKSFLLHSFQSQESARCPEKMTRWERAECMGPTPSHCSLITLEAILLSHPSLSNFLHSQRRDSPIKMIFYL